MAECADSRKFIEFSLSHNLPKLRSETENTCAFSYSLDPAHLSKVTAIASIAGSHIVAAGLENGRVFLLDSTCYPIKCVNAEDNFVVTEIGVVGTSILCSITTITRDAR